MIVITTPTWKIDSNVVKHLVAAKETVRVIAGDPCKLAPELSGHVEVLQGSSDGSGENRGRGRVQSSFEEAEGCK